MAQPQLPFRASPIDDWEKRRILASMRGVRVRELDDSLDDLIDAINDMEMLQREAHDAMAVYVAAAPADRLAAWNVASVRMDQLQMAREALRIRISAATAKMAIANKLDPEFLLEVPPDVDGRSYLAFFRDLIREGLELRDRGLPEPPPTINQFA